VSRQQTDRKIGALGHVDDVLRLSRHGDAGGHAQRQPFHAKRENLLGVPRRGSGLAPACSVGQGIVPGVPRRTQQQSQNAAAGSGGAFPFEAAISPASTRFSAEDHSLPLLTSGHVRRHLDLRSRAPACAAELIPMKMKRIRRTQTVSAAEILEEGGWAPLEIHSDQARCNSLERAPWRAEKQCQKHRARSDATPGAKGVRCFT
jgi:hypothetical protein